MTGQLSLFDTAPAAAAQLHVDALHCLRDAMPDALHLVVRLANPNRRDSRTVRASGNWAYCVTNAGLRYQLADAWWSAGGWDRMPTQLCPWDQLAQLIGEHPHRAEITAWVDSLPEPRWRALRRPYELWPDPGSWHPSYIAGDHAEPGWPARRQAWQLVLDLLTDAAGDRGHR